MKGVWVVHPPHSFEQMWLYDDQIEAMVGHGAHMVIDFVPFGEEVRQFVGRK